MAIRKCPKCSDPNFDDGACGCGWCEKCHWRQTCTQGGWYDKDFGSPQPPFVFTTPQIITTGIIPMATRKVTKQIPYCCPVCKGKGEVGRDQAPHEAQPKYEGTEVYACHACCGSCLIWEIREEEVEDEIPVTQIQLPPTILSPQVVPNLPNIGLPQPYTVGDPPYPYGVTWTSASNNRPPELGKGLQAYNSPAWKFGGLNDGGCACSPPGTPHHDNCKAG